MKELMYLLRAIRIYSQNAHHLVKGTPFHSDHNFFGDVYNEVGGDFDDVAERIIGLYGEEHLNLQNMLQAVVKLKNLIKQIIASGVSPGVEQLIGDIANKSEMRCYKIKQRMK